MKRIPKEWIETEARRIARNMVRDELKRVGIKLSYVEASEIDKAVKGLLEQQGKGIRATARRSVSRRFR